jgi:hypothetical protein
MPLTWQKASEQIAAKVRCQSVGAVIADICRDLGIMPDHPLWPEFQALIQEYRGNYGRLVIEILRRPRRFLFESACAASQAEPFAPVCAAGPP